MKEEQKREFTEVQMKRAERLKNFKFLVFLHAPTKINSKAYRENVSREKFGELTDRVYEMFDNYDNGFEQVFGTLVGKVSPRWKETNRYTLDVLLKNLCANGLGFFTGVVLDRTSTFWTANRSSLPKYFKIKCLVDQIKGLERLGYLELHLGSSGQNRNSPTKIKATEALLKIMTKNKNFTLISNLTMRPSRKETLVIKKSSSGEVEVDENDIRVKALRSFIDKYHSEIEKHTFLFYGKSGEPEFHMPYGSIKFIDGFDKGGRMYCAFQSYPKVNRFDTRIDDGPILEVDFSANHLNISYAEEGVCTEDMDYYKIEGLTRKEAKAVVMPIMNSNKRYTAILSIVSSVREQCIKELKALDFDKEELQDKEVLKILGIEKKGAYRIKNKYNSGKSATNRKKMNQVLKASERKDIKRVIGRAVRTEARAGEIYDLFIEKHHQIAHKFNKEEGTRCQAIESKILRVAMEELIDEYGIISLPMHDALLCKRQDVKKVKEAMARAWEKEFPGTSGKLSVATKPGVLD